MPHRKLLPTRVVGRLVLVLSCTVLFSCDVGGAVGNRRPLVAIVEWPVELRVGELAVVKAEGYDPDGDRIRIFVAWGDGDTSDHGEFVLSGQTVVFEHRYRYADTFVVRARCHDLAPLFSDWSSPRVVRVTGVYSSVASLDRDRSQSSTSASKASKSR